MKVLFVDTETTGLDSKLNDVIQVAFIIEIDGKVKEKANFIMQPFRYDTITKEALEVNGLTIKKLITFPKPQETYNQIVTLFDKYINKYDKQDKFSPAGHNVTFDRNMLNQFFLKNGNKYFGSYVDYHLIDTSSLLYLLRYAGKLELESYKLETASKHFKIPLQAHNAMSDIEATRELIQKLLRYLK